MSSFGVVVCLSFFVSSAYPAPQLVNSDSLPVSKFGGIKTENKELKKTEMVKSEQDQKDLDHLFKKLFLYINAHFRDTNTAADLKCETIEEDKDYFVFYEVKGKLFPKRKPAYVATIQPALGIKKYFEISAEKKNVRLISTDLMFNESQEVTDVPSKELKNKSRPVIQVKNGKFEATNTNDMEEAAPLTTLTSLLKNNTIKEETSTDVTKTSQHPYSKNFTILNDTKTFPARSSQATMPSLPTLDSNSHIPGIQIYEYVADSENAQNSSEHKSYYLDSSSTMKYATLQTSFNVYTTNLTKNGNETQIMSTYPPNIENNVLTTYPHLTSFESIDKSQNIIENNTSSTINGITNRPLFAEFNEKIIDQNNSISQIDSTRSNQSTTNHPATDSKKFTHQMSDIFKQFTTFNDSAKRDQLNFKTTFYLTPDYFGLFKSSNEASYSPPTVIKDITIETMETTTPLTKYNTNNSSVPPNANETKKSAIEKITISNYTNISTEMGTSEESTFPPINSSNSPHQTISIFENPSKAQNGFQDNVESEQITKAYYTSSPVDETNTFGYLTSTKETITITDRMYPLTAEYKPSLTISSQNLTENKLFLTVTSPSPNNFNNESFYLQMSTSSSFDNNTTPTSVIFEPLNPSELFLTESQQEISNFDLKFENRTSPSYPDHFTSNSFDNNTTPTLVRSEPSNYSEVFFTMSELEISDLNSKFENRSSPYSDLNTPTFFDNNTTSTSEMFHISNHSEVFFTDSQKEISHFGSTLDNRSSTSYPDVYNSTSFDNITTPTSVMFHISNNTRGFSTKSQLEISDYGTIFENRSSPSYPVIYTSSSVENNNAPTSVRSEPSNHSEVFSNHSQLEISDLDSKFENPSSPYFPATNSHLEGSISFQTLSYESDEESTIKDKNLNITNEKETSYSLVTTPSFLYTVLNLTEQQHAYFQSDSSESETQNMHESKEATFPTLSHFTNITGKIEEFSNNETFNKSSFAETTGFMVDKSSAPLTTAITIGINNELQYSNWNEVSTTVSYENSYKNVYNSTQPFTSTENSSLDYSLLPRTTSSVRHIDYTYSRSDYSSQLEAFRNKKNDYSMATSNKENITSSSHGINSSVTQQVSSSFDNESTKEATLKMDTFYQSDISKHFGGRSSLPSFNYMIKNQSEKLIQAETSGHYDKDDYLVEEKSTPPTTVIIEDENVETMVDLSSKAEKQASSNPTTMVNIVINQRSSISPSENVVPTTPLLVSTKGYLYGPITEISTTELNILHYNTENMSIDMIVTGTNDTRKVSIPLTDTSISATVNQTKILPEKTNENSSYSSTTLFGSTINKEETQTSTSEINIFNLTTINSDNLTIDEGSVEVTTIEIQKYPSSENTLHVETTTQRYEHLHTHTEKNDSVIIQDEENGNTSIYVDTTKIANFSYNEKNQTIVNIAENSSATSIENPEVISKTTPKYVIPVSITSTHGRKSERPSTQKINHEIISPKINSEISSTTEKRIDLEMSTQHYETMASFNNFTFLLPTTDYLTTYLPVRIHPFIVFSEI